VGPPDCTCGQSYGQPNQVIGSMRHMKDFDHDVRLPKMSELQVLVAIADTGSFGGAAAELGCTQSRISHSIAALEGALANQLLERSRTGTAPTPIGHKVILKAREILKLAQSTMPSKSQTLSGVVRLATYQSVATHLLLPIIDALAIRHPHIRIEIDDGCIEREDVERRVRDGSADLGIAHLPVGAGLSIRPFAEDDYVVIVAGNHTPSKRYFWQDLERLDFIELRCSGSRSIVEKCHANGMRAKPTKSFSSVSTILAYVTKGRSFSILPRLSVEPLPAGVKVVDLPVNARRSLAIILPRQQAGAKERAVLQTFRQLRGFQQPVAGWARLDVTR
jgi:DNA-binding transcriptional LysR family regulator